jgi:hypothetical protein
MTIILTPTFTPSVATVTYASMVPEMSAFLQGCPSLVIERTIRKIIIDLCQRAKIWREETLPLNTVMGEYSYGLQSPYAFAEAIDILSGTIIYPDATKTELSWQPYAKVQRQLPNWPQNAEGTPMYVTSKTFGAVALAPTPESVGELTVNVVLRPTATSTEWLENLYNEFRREVFHGVLHELLLMPDRSWYDEKTGMYHGKQWTYLLSQARDRAERGRNADVLSVEMRPFA